MKNSSRIYLVSLLLAREVDGEFLYDGCLFAGACKTLINLSPQRRTIMKIKTPIKGLITTKVLVLFSLLKGLFTSRKAFYFIIILDIYKLYMILTLCIF